MIRRTSRFLRIARLELAVTAPTRAAVAASIATVVAAIVACAVVGTTPARAEICKWVDERGVVNYGERPPPARPSQVITPAHGRLSVYESTAVAPTVSTGDRALARQVEELERQLARQRQDQQNAAQLAADVEAQRLERCRLERRVDCYGEALDVQYPSVVIVQRPPHLRHHLPTRTWPPPTLIESHREAAPRLRQEVRR